MTGSPEVRRTAAGVAVLFFVNGVAFGSWVPRIPAVKARLALDVGTLGLVLLGTGLGGLVGSILAGWLVDRLGSRRSATWAAGLVAAALPLVAVAPSAVTLGLVLFTVGTADAVTDIGMNAQAVQLQARRVRSVMNRFHAVWSLGTVAGAVGAIAAAAAGIALGPHLILVGAAKAAALVWAWGRLIPTDVGRSGVRRWGALSAPALALGAAGLAAALAEGTAGDWSAVFVSDALSTGEATAGGAFLAFTVAMLAGRLGGDALVDRLGRRRLQIVSLSVAGAGIALAATAAAVPVAMAGFGLAGIGISVLFPMLYGASGLLGDVGAGAGIATMSFGARIGFLVASPVVGLLGETLGLRPALAIVIGSGLLLTGLFTPVR